MALRRARFFTCAGGLAALAFANGCGLLLELPEPDASADSSASGGGSAGATEPICERNCGASSGGAAGATGGSGGTTASGGASGGSKSSGGGTSGASGGEAGASTGGAPASGGAGSGGESSGGASGSGGSGGSGGSASGGAGGCLSPCDCDGDGYLAKNTTCGGDDCDDHDAQVNPGQTGYFPDRSANEQVGFDYNCNGVLERDPEQGTTALSCLDLDLLNCTNRQGFHPSLPPCGQPGKWSECRGLLGVCGAHELDASVVARCR